MNHYHLGRFEVKMAITAIFAMLLLGSGLMPASTSASDSSVVSIFVDGDKTSITTSAQTVGEVLDRADIELGEADIVEPAADKEITSQVFNINVYRARAVLIADGEDEYRVESAYRSARLIAEHAEGVEVYEEDKVTGHVIDDFVDERHIGYKVDIERATPVNLDMGGSSTTLRTHAATVEEMFAEAGIDIGNNDIVRPGLSAAVEPGMKVSLTQVGFETVTEEVEIKPDTVTEYDNNRPLDYEEVEKQGTPGIALVTYEIEYRNGEEAKRREMRRVVERQPEDTVVVIGNKRDAYSDDTEKLLYDLRMCETGGRYSANTGNGFYGAYQFMISTWDRVAPKVGRPDLVGVRPDRAAPSDQDYMVIENAKISAGGFWSQHPGCSDKLGLPQFP